MGAGMSGDSPQQADQKVALGPRDQVLEVLRDGGRLWDQPVSGGVLLVDREGERVDIAGVEYQWQLRQLVSDLRDEGLMEQTGKSQNGGHSILRTSFSNPAFMYAITEKGKIEEPQS